jgi:hypothetical protein
MSDMIKIRLYVGTGFATANHQDVCEVERTWWESLTEKEQEKELDRMALEFLWNCVECSAWVLEDEEYE